MHSQKYAVAATPDSDRMIKVTKYPFQMYAACPAVPVASTSASGNTPSGNTPACDQACQGSRDSQLAHQRSDAYYSQTATDHFNENMRNINNQIAYNVGSG